MAADDMHVVMYKILAYLYECMKSGEKPVRANIECTAFGINKLYWSSIFAELAERGYVKGVRIIHGDYWDEVYISEPRITMAGVEFMMENSMMKRALAFIREIKDTVPGI